MAEQTPTPNPATAPAELEEALLHERRRLDQYRTELTRLATRLATRGITLTTTVADAALTAIDTARQLNTELRRQLVDAHTERSRWQARAVAAEQLATTRLTAALRTLADLRDLDEHGDRVRAAFDQQPPGEED